MIFSSLTVLAVALTSGHVSGFAPLLDSPTRLVPRSTSHLDASAGLATPSTEPVFFFQSRTAEPKDVESVPYAAHHLSKTFPEEPFVIDYRTTNIGRETRPILELSVLKKIEIDRDGDWVKVDAGVTVRELASELSSSDDDDLKELFLTLPASGELSVVEAALDERFEKLRSAVEEVHFVDKNGNISSKQLGDIDEEQEIVVNVILSPPEPPVKRSRGFFRSDKVIARWYTRKPNPSSAIQKGFVSDLPDFVKVMVYKYGFLFERPEIVLFVDGDEDINLSSDEWRETIVHTPEEFWNLQNDLSVKANLDVLTASGVLDIDASKIDPSFTDILNVFQDREEHLMITIEKGEIRASFDSKYPPNVDDATRELFTFDDNSKVIISPAARSKPNMIMDGTPMVVTPTIIEGTVIQGPDGVRFNGEVYDGMRRTMQNMRFQYATSSYDNLMNPSLIVYPRDEASVKLAIKYATSDDNFFKEARKTEARPSGSPFKVIGRGGGHQYCGVSCDNGALIISMDHFQKLEHKFFEKPKEVTGPDGKPHTITREVHVGTGVILKDWAEFANKGWAKDEEKRPDTAKAAKGNNGVYGFTIPHGECPTVGIGGHSQTGGYGHIARAFGLAIDYIYGFTIVTANGEVRTVTRDSTEQTDKNLYWAVLGGSPGAFGVTTNLIIHPILDEDYPNSSAWKSSLPYNKQYMKKILDIMEDFVNRARGPEDDDNTIAEGLDLMISLSSNNDNSGRTGLMSIPNSISGIIFELECRDMKDEKAKRQMEEIINNFENSIKDVDFRLLDPSTWKLLQQIGTPYDGKSHYKLSELSLGFTRKPPSVTKSGRENRRPYRKASYGSRDKLKPGWSEAYANLLDDVVTTKEDIACVFQIVVGGGAMARLGEAGMNSISHRDVQLCGVVFDLFHGQSDDTIKKADEFGKRFEFEIVNKYQSAYPKVMAQWASHGDLDMNKKEVWEKYFDKPETYAKLRSIKKDVDPDDIFHSRFTLRPAED